LEFFGILDAAQGGLLGVGEAFGVDAEEDGNAVACPLGDLRRGNPVFTQVGTAACRRSWGGGQGAMLALIHGPLRRR
jgi:hypothetical protein